MQRDLSNLFDECLDDLGAPSFSLSLVDLSFPVTGCSLELSLFPTPTGTDPVPAESSS